MVGANEATCLYVLPEVFGEYCRHYPDVQISIYRNFTYKIVEKLENGSLDVGVLSLPDPVAQPEGSADFPRSPDADGESEESAGEDEIGPHQ